LSLALSKLAGILVLLKLAFIIRAYNLRDFERLNRLKPEVQKGK
jgi:HAMP domain-containing protein